ncbi:MAG: hypothetical protein ACE5R6_17390 [Candidatus Heimdallarchaeota archaeon]
MTRKRIALIGYGNVGKAVTELLAEVDPKGTKFTFSAIGSRSLGLLELNKAPPSSVKPQVDVALQNTKLKTIKDATYEITSWLREGDYDVLVEAIIANYDTGEPAITYIKTAFEQGKDVITCNKAPLVLAMDRLQVIAARSGARLRYESTVLDGTPIFSIFRNALPKVRVKRIRGILNSTVNVVLDYLHQKLNLEQGIENAKMLGTAEEDPSLDLEGIDAAAKLVILVNTLSEMKIKLSDVEKQPLTQETFENARNTCLYDQNIIIRQVSIADFNSKTYRVNLEAVHPFDFLYGCRSTSNAAVFSLDLFGELVIAEQNPSLKTTAFGIYSDLIDILQHGTVRV